MQIYNIILHFLHFVCYKTKLPEQLLLEWKYFGNFYYQWTSIYSKIFYILRE